MIREALPQDIDAVEKSYIDLLTYEKEHGGQSNWELGVYPTRAVAEKALVERALYVLYADDALCASVILNQRQLEDYRKIAWAYPAEDRQVLVIHTLCVPPNMAGRGYGRQMVSYAMALAREKGCRAIRLDTFAGNIPAQSLYRRMGFRLAGTAQVLFQGSIAEELVFMEYCLSPDAGDPREGAAHESSPGCPPTA